MSTTITTRSTHETEALGERLGALLQPGDVLCLAGELGAGKTAFTRGLARGWGTPDPVTSPTYTLVNEYRRDGEAFYHIDCYRLADSDEARTIALDDIVADEDGVLVIEWPERILDALPDERLWLTLEHTGEGERTITITAEGERPSELLAAVTA